MADSMLLLKAALIEKCVARALEEYQRAPDTFADDLTRQDAAIFNIHRACQAALAMGYMVVKRERLGTAISAAQVFDLLHGAGWLSPALLEALHGLMRMDELAVRYPESMQVSVLISVIMSEVVTLEVFACTILRRERRNADKHKSNPASRPPAGQARSHDHR